MSVSLETLRKDDQGFTLVELAVVMIIIGLLVGGILKGQELITNARVTSSISQFEALGAAYNGFRDQFNAVPGDFRNAQARLSNCANPCINGNGNGLVDREVGQAPAAEGTGFFYHLLAAGFITGLDGSNTVGFGTSNPTAPIGGGFTVGDPRAGGNPSGFTANELRPAPHLVLTGTVANVGANQGVLTPQQASTVDTRLDDSNPSEGSVVSQSTANTCRANATTYDNNVNQVCAVAYRL